MLNYVSLTLIYMGSIYVVLAEINISGLLCDMNRTLKKKIT